MSEIIRSGYKKAPAGDMVMLHRDCPNCASKLWFDTKLKRMHCRQEIICIQCGWYNTERFYYDHNDKSFAEGYYSMKYLNTKRHNNGFPRLTSREESLYTCPEKSLKFNAFIRILTRAIYAAKSRPIPDSKLWEEE